MSGQIPESAVPGVELCDPASARHPLEDLARDRMGWAAIFEEARQQIRGFIGCRDALEVLCKTTTYRLIWEANSAEKSDKSSVQLEQADVEALHAFVVMYGDTSKKVPTAPSSYERFWPVLSRMLFAFSRMQAFGDSADNDPNSAIARVRLHTIYYRNPLGGDDCRKAVRNILGRIDEIAQRDLGFRLSDAFEMLLIMIETIKNRLEVFRDHFNVLRAGKDKDKVERSIEALRKLSPVVPGLLNRIDQHNWNLKARAAAALQVCDAIHSWIYNFERADLLKEFGEPLIRFLDEITMPLGNLEVNPDHIYMNNPIWARPLIGLPSGRLLFPEPYIPLSFPFRVFEPFIAKSPALKGAYERARSTFLEERIDEIVRLSIPSASVYKNVEWTDPSTGRTYENDIVAILGNHIFLFEAKSGRLDDAGRRGAPRSLLENLRELYVEPGEQAFRLQQYLAEHKANATLKLKGGAAFQIPLDRPKIVQKYSVAIEHYTSLTSGKQNYVELGLIKNADAWAPVLSIGELEMLSRHLDTEISFFSLPNQEINARESRSLQG